jgi:hypothetical protein
MNTKNFLIATIKVPVKVNPDGEIIMLDDYAEISVEPLTTEPRQTFDSISEKIIEYVHKNPEYLTSIVQETETFNKAFDQEDTFDQTFDQEEAIEEEESILHRFAYFKKSKKPLNISFRNKGKKHNFTKKNYD